MISSENMKQNHGEVISNVKLNKLLLRKNVRSKLQTYLENQVNIRNMLMVFQLSKRFGLPSLFNTTFSHMERCFTTLAETRNFLELELSLVAKFLNSSELLISSELEIFNAANYWLSHNIKNRNKFAKYLLLKVRLPLLSYSSLEHLINTCSSFTENSDCMALLKEVSESKDSFFQHKPRICCTHRNCNQNMFNVLICGGSDDVSNRVVGNVNEINGKDFSSFKALPPMVKQRYLSEAVCIKRDVYVFGGLDVNRKMTMSVEKYSLDSKEWKIVAEMHEYREDFCTCAFMNKIFAMGGDMPGKKKVTNSCLQFDTSDYKWKEAGAMNQARMAAACAVFEGKIVVSGGLTYGYGGGLRAVESYDVTGDAWTPMCGMINGNFGHSMVAVRNKLFVMEPQMCEVYDSAGDKFVLLKSLPGNVSYFCTAVSIGHKIYAFNDGAEYVICYDTHNDVWTEEPFELLPFFMGFSCVKVPSF